MKLSLGICILAVLSFSACTTEGEGNEFITKLASREEANEIMDYVNQQVFFSSLKNAASGNKLYYVDSSRFHQIERQKQYYTYDPVAGHFKYIVSVTVPYSDSTRTQNSVSMSKEYFAASPHTAIGLPSQPLYDLRYELSSYHGTETTFLSTGITRSFQSYDSLVLSVDEMPFVHLTRLDTMSLTAHYESFSKSGSEKTSIEARFSLDQVFQSKRYGTTSGIGKLKFTSENLKYDLNVTLETEYNESNPDPMTGYLTMYLDLAGFRYKQTEFPPEWIPVD